MIFGSLCSGIEAASVAWQPLDMKPAFYSEIEPYPCAVLAHHHPTIPNLGDMTKYEEWPDYAIDLLVGGTPCQSFSVAGLRKGLADPRGNLMLTFGAVAKKYKPRWVVWENVPGVLSSNGGRDFGAFLGMLGELGYGIAYRVLDAQYVRVESHPFAVPQRRRRVFVVGYLGDWRRPAAVLFERESLRGHPPPRRQAGKGITFDASPSLTASGRGTKQVGESRGQDCLVPEVANPLTARMHKGVNTTMDEGQTMVAHALRAGGFDASEDGTGRSTPLVPVHAQEVADPLSAHEQSTYTHEGRNFRTRNVTAFEAKQSGESSEDVAPTLRAMGHDGSHANAGGQIAIAQSSRGKINAQKTEARPIEALRTLQDAVDPQTLCEWCFGILAAFWPQEILRSEMHGRRFRRATQPERGLVNVALSRSKIGASWSVQDLWEAGCDGRSPSGWQPQEQLAVELGSYLSRLPYAPSPAETFLHDMWQAAEGSRILREALSTVQATRQSVVGKNKSAQRDIEVRRLTVEECEALQGFPRSYTLVSYRGRPAADGPRYKALGNSMAVNVMRWIGERIMMVDKL